MMVINNLFNIEDLVYLKTDPDQKKRIVTAMLIRPGGSYSYELSCGTEAKWFYEFEISAERDVIISTQ
jgi:hypothetical protein